MFSKVKPYFTLGLVLMLLLLVMSGAVMAQDEATEEGPPRVGARFDTPTYGVHGPYWIGTREIEVERGEYLLKGNIWYPALNPDGVAYEEHGYSSHSEEIWESWGMGVEWAVLFGTALADAPVDPADAPYPLIILTHGFAVSRTVVAYLGEHLASYGFVVMAIDHPNGGFIDQLNYGLGSEELGATFPLVYTQWALEELRLIDHARELNEAEGDFSGLIDLAKVGAIGYSSGGHTALQLAGAAFDFASLPGRFAEDCAQPKDREVEAGCNLFPAMEAELAEMANVEFVAGQPWGVVAESAVQAVVGLAPGSMIPFGMNGNAAVDVPTLIIAGTQDSAVPPDHMQYAYENLSSAQKGMVWLENGGHFIFMDCDWQTELFGGFCADSVWDMTRASDITKHFATALFLSALYGDAEAAAALNAEAVDMPGILYEAVGY